MDVDTYEGPVGLYGQLTVMLASLLLVLVGAFFWRFRSRAVRYSARAAVACVVLFDGLQLVVAYRDGIRWPPSRFGDNVPWVLSPAADVFFVITWAALVIWSMSVGDRIGRHVFRRFVMPGVEFRTQIQSELRSVATSSAALWGVPIFVVVLNGVMEVVFGQRSAPFS